MDVRWTPSLVLVAACAAPPDPVARGPEGGGSAAPERAAASPGPLAHAALPELRGERFETIWEYVAATYDANGNAAVEPSEYPRPSETFERLDADEDGVLTEADFGGEELLVAEMWRFLARDAVARFLQADEDPTTLTLDELFTAAAAYDVDGDERLTKQELDALADRRRQDPPRDPEARMMGDYPVWKALCSAMDADVDERLSFEELGLFFEANDPGGDLVWELEYGPEPGPGDEPASGPRVGTLAPDFELDPLPVDGGGGGGEPVRLSSHRGERPVALIFGSYT